MSLDYTSLMVLENILFLILLVAIGLYIRHGRQERLVETGRQALSEQPDTITLVPAAGAKWRDPKMAEWLAKPLREKGFVDLGIYNVLPLHYFRLGVMVNERDNVAAFLTEHPWTLGISLELNVRYVDGTTTMLINRADRGVPRPSFFRVLFADPDTPSGALYERLLHERSPGGIKKITTQTVLSEYQDAWTRLVRWEKGRGLTEEEVEDIGHRATRPESLLISGKTPVMLWPSDTHAGTLYALKPDFSQYVSSTSRRMKLGAQLLMAAPGIVFLLVALHGLSADYRHMKQMDRRREARTAQAEATTIEVHDVWHRRDRIPNGAGVYAFTAASGQVVTWHYYGTAKLGDTAMVHYDPRDPNNNSFGDDRVYGFSDVISYNLFFLLAGSYYMFLAVWIGRLVSRRPAT